MLIVGLMTTMVLGACAQRPEKIGPAGIDIAAQTNKSCSQLRLALANEQGNVNTLSSKQNSAANGDALGVFLIGVPTSSLTGGDVETELSIAKGKVVSIETALQIKKC